MTEKKIVIDKLRLSYEGLFSVVELYKIIDTFLREKGYDKRERVHQERVLPEGKYIELEIEPWKKYTDYVKSEIRTRIIMKDVKEVEIERDKMKVRLNQGKVQFVFDGYLTTDYEGRWEQKPIFFFLRTIFDKYVYKIYTGKYEGQVIEDVNQLHARIKAFLNLYRYSEESTTAPTGKVQFGPG